MLPSQESFEWRNGILVDSRLKSTENTVWRTSEFDTRARVQHTTSWCEQLLGEGELGKALDMSGISMDDTVMDLGCGDGRYVHYFLKRGHRRIVALNYELEPLIQLSNSLSDSESECVMLICADIFDHPLKVSQANFVLAWGLMTSTTDFEHSLNQCLDILVDSGWLFNAEPVLEQALVYSLVKGDLAEFQRTLTTRTRPRMWNEREHRYQVLTLHELSAAMTSSRLNIVRQGGISTLPSLVFGGLLDGDQKLPIDVSRQSLWDAMSSIRCGWDRQVTFLSQKLS